MFEPPPYHDVAALSRLDDEELTRMANDGELGTADLVAARLQKYLNEPKSAPAPEPLANDGWNDYATACLAQIFPPE